MKPIIKKAALSGLFSLTLTLGTVLAVSAQCVDYNWPVDGAAKAKAEESLVLLKDNKGSSPKQAITPLNWIISNKPDLNKSVYIYGAEIYDALAKGEKDPAKKGKYIDSLLIIYDLRIQHTPCDEVPSITNRKALAAYIYLINSDKAKDLLGMMNKAFELNKAEIMDGTLVPYMQTIQVNKLKFNNMTDEEVLQKYDELISITDAKIKEAKAAGKPIDRYVKYKEQIEDILIHTIKFDCDLVKKNLEPKYRANPTDIELAKKIFTFMLAGKCTEDPLWLETGEAIIKDAVNKGEKPDFGITKNVSIRYLAQDKYGKAEELFKIALDVAPGNSDKADIFIYLGSIEAKKGSKVAARNYYRQALTADPDKKEAYERIGDLYMNSGPDCNKEQSYAEDRLIYIAAYDMYARAGDQKRMAEASRHFPSKTELFEMNWKEGETKRIDCWVGETVTLRTRKE